MDRKIQESIRKATFDGTLDQLRAGHDRYQRILGSELFETFEPSASLSSTEESLATTCSVAQWKEIQITLATFQQFLGDNACLLDIDSAVIEELFLVFDAVQETVRGTKRGGLLSSKDVQRLQVHADLDQLQVLHRYLHSQGHADIIIPSLIQTWQTQRENLQAQSIIDALYTAKQYFKNIGVIQASTEQLAEFIIEEAFFALHPQMRDLPLVEQYEQAQSANMLRPLPHEVAFVTLEKQLIDTCGSMQAFWHQCLHLSQ